ESDLDPVGLRQVVDPGHALDEGARPGEQQPATFELLWIEVRQGGTARVGRHRFLRGTGRAQVSSGLSLFLPNESRDLRLPHNSILTPCRCMIVACWMIERKLFHAQ